MFPHSTTSGSSSGSWSGQFNGELMWSVDVVSHLNDPASPRPPPRVISAGTDGARAREERSTDGRTDGWMDRRAAADAELKLDDDSGKRYGCITTAFIVLFRLVQNQGAS